MQNIWRKQEPLLYAAVFLCEEEVKMVKVSVVVPVYNVEKYLYECLDGIRNQTLQEIEIICVDDGSTDSSRLILDEYAMKDDRFRVIHKENEGYGKSVNVGMSAASGMYTAIVESDDIISENMYETLFYIMEEKKLDVIKTDYYQFYEGLNGEYIQEYRELWWDKEKYEKVFRLKEYEEAMLFQKYTWSGMYRTAFLKENHIRHNETPGASFQDNGFWFQTMVKADSIYFLPQAFYKYRIDNYGASSFSKEKVFAICDEYNFIDAILDEMGETGKPYYRWSTFFRLRDCIYTILRVTNSSKEIVAKTIRDDFFKHASLGRIDLNIYPSWYKDFLLRIIVSPSEYAKEEIRRLDKITKLVGAYDVIILYGAGNIGTKMLDILREERKNTKVKCFAVTEKGNNPEKKAGIPILLIDELREYRKDALVIISVGQKVEKEVEKKLQERGFENYIYYRDFL